MDIDTNACKKGRSYLGLSSWCKYRYKKMYGDPINIVQTIKHLPCTKGHCGRSSIHMVQSHARVIHNANHTSTCILPNSYVGFVPIATKIVGTENVRMWGLGPPQTIPLFGFASIRRGFYKPFSSLALLPFSSLPCLLMSPLYSHQCYCLTFFKKHVDLNMSIIVTCNFT